MLAVRNKISHLMAKRIVQIIEEMINSVEEGARSLF